MTRKIDFKNFKDLEMKLKKLKNPKKGFISQLPFQDRNEFSDAVIYASNFQTTEDKKKIVTKISFTKKSLQIPRIQRCHRVILASAGNEFFKRILQQGFENGEDIHISMPDFDKKEIDTFLNFIYGKISEIDTNLPICQMFLKKDLKEDVLEVEIKEDEIKEDEVKNADVKEDEVKEDVISEPDDHFDAFEDPDFVPDSDNEEEIKQEASEPQNELIEVNNDIDIEMSPIKEQTSESSKKVKKKQEQKYRNKIKEQRNKLIAEAINAENKEGVEMSIIEDSIWSCQFCQELKDQTFSAYTSHFHQSHQKLPEKEVSCEKCGKLYEGKEELLIHYVNENCQRNFNPTLKCQICPCKFFSFSNLQSHILTHHSSNCKANLKSNWCMYFCEVCAKLFQDVEVFQKHQDEVHDLNFENFASEIERKIANHYHIVDKPTKKPEEEPKTMQVFCRLCQKKFESKKDYKIHYALDGPHEKDLKKIKSKRMQYELGYMNIGFTYPPNFKEMELNAYCYCYVCNKRFGNRSAFQKHARMHHSSDKVFPCRKCGEAKPTFFAEYNHRKTCGRTIPCSQCNLKFFSEHTLKVHITNFHYQGEKEAKRAIHERVKLANGKLAYKCDVCEKVLNSNKAVYHHKQVYHPTEKVELIKCPKEGCNYSTTLQMNFKNHMYRTHGEKKHICDQCGDKFIGPRELKLHYVRTHKPEEHTCEECGKMFTNLPSLQKHKECHGGPNHICSICGKAFHRTNNLRTHMKFAHSEVRNFICECGKGFKTKAHLNRHLQTSSHGGGRKVQSDGVYKVEFRQPLGRKSIDTQLALARKRIC